MGDTFIDRWEDEIPREHRGWKLVDVNNTKWDGNFYYYEPAVELASVRHRIYIRSSNGRGVDLNCGIDFSDGIITTSLVREFNPDIHGTYLSFMFHDFTQVLDCAIDMLQELDRVLPPFRQKVNEAGWAQRYQ